MQRHCANCSSIYIVLAPGVSGEIKGTCAEALCRLKLNMHCAGSWCYEICCYHGALSVVPPAMGIVVHTQGGAHTRWSVATAGVLSFEGVRGLAPALSVARHSVGTVGAHYTPNATLFTRVPLPWRGGGLALTRRTGGFGAQGGVWR